AVSGGLCTRREFETPSHSRSAAFSLRQVGSTPCRRVSVEPNVDHMSMWSLISNASFVVQLVMLILVAASVMSWIIIFQRGNMLRAAKRALDTFEERFWSGIDLSKLYRQAGSNPDPDSGVEQIFRAGFKEFSRLRQQPGVDPDAVMDAVNRAMRVAI